MAGLDPAISFGDATNLSGITGTSPVMTRWVGRVTDKIFRQQPRKLRRPYSLAAPGTP
jgi:hypothetical protein